MGLGLRFGFGLELRLGLGLGLGFGLGWEPVTAAMGREGGRDGRAGRAS